MIGAPEFIGKGAYSLAEAARIVRAPYTTVRGWLDPDSGLVPRKFDAELHVVSFAELMEIHFIKMFLNEGLHPHVIHAAARAAAKRYNSDYPFTVKRFDTDGRTIFATAAKESGEVMIEDLRKGQLVFKNIIRPFFKKLDYNRSDISRYWPMGKRGRVALDPERQFGRPIDFETGIPTVVLFDATKAGKGQSIRRVADWYGIPESAVRAAVKFEKSLT